MQEILHIQQGTYTLYLFVQKTITESYLENLLILHVLLLVLRTVIK